MTLLSPAPAVAAEIFGGIYVHDVDTPLSKSGIEGGADLQLGWRGQRIRGTVLQPYAFVAANTRAETHYAAVGLSAKFGRTVYIRPGLGVAIHSGSSRNFETKDRIAFGSRILFAPEVAIGAHVTDGVSAEASWVHLSHAQLFGRQNPGIDNFGMRLNFAF